MVRQGRTLIEKPLCNHHYCIQPLLIFKLLKTANCHFLNTDYRLLKTAAIYCPSSSFRLDDTYVLLLRPCIMTTTCFTSSSVM